MVFIEVLMKVFHAFYGKYLALEQQLAGR